MKKKALALLLAMAMTATMAGCGLAATTAPDNSSNNDSNNDSTKSDNTEVGTYGSSAETQGKTNPIVVKVSNGAGETSPGVKAQLSVFAPMVENNSKGNIGVEVYSGAQLGDDTTATEMVVAGQLEINNTSTAPLVGYVPELGIFDIPFLFDMSKKIWDTYDADTQAILTEAAKAFGEEEKKINRQAAADNLQSCIDDYGMEVTYLTDDAKAEFVAKTAHIQDMIAKDTGAEIMDLLAAAKG